MSVRGSGLYYTGLVWAKGYLQEIVQEFRILTQTGCQKREFKVVAGQSEYTEMSWTVS